MKKIINNKLYDTDNAKIIFEFCIKLKGEDCWFKDGYAFYYWTNAQIYKTTKGNYFYHYDASGDYDEIIEPTTLEDVKILIKKINPDKYIELFGNNEIEDA